MSGQILDEAAIRELAATPASEYVIEARDVWKRYGSNEVLQGAVQGIAELITRPGLINVDFADVRTVMSETGLAMMGSGIGTGEHRAKVAAEMAVSSPLLEDINLAGAHGILVNVTAGLDLSIGEFEEVGSLDETHRGAGGFGSTGR